MEFQPMIKVTIFDLDETLLYHGSSTRHFAKDQYHRFLDKVAGLRKLVHSES